MPNFWIVSSHQFRRHKDCAVALAEAQRLAEKTGKPFHVYRVKNKLTPGSEPGSVATVSTIEVLSAALDRYRYAVAYADADAWDGGHDIRQRFAWARAHDPGGQLSNDHLAEVGKTFHAWQSPTLLPKEAP